jgi:hypothetical protein
MYAIFTKLEYYQSLTRGYEEAAIESQENVASYRDMLESMYKPFSGLSPERARLLNTIKVQNDSVYGGQSKQSGPFKTDLSSVAGGFSSYNPYQTQNKSG